MKIGFLTTEYLLDDRIQGGLGNYLRRITLALAEEGQDVHVFYYSDRPPSIEVDRGITIHLINSHSWKMFRLINKATRKKLRQTLSGLERCLRFRRYVLRAIQEHSIEILQIPNTGFPGLLVPRNIPIVLRNSSYRPKVDHFDQRRITIDRWILTKLELTQYRRVSGIFAPTRMLANILIDELNLEDVAVIRTPFYNECQEIDEDSYRKHLAGKGYLLFFGRLSPMKGAQVLAKALPRVWLKHPDLLAVFVGNNKKIDGNRTMIDLIKEECAGFEDNVKFFPFLPHRQLYPIITHARLVALPSYFDNSPNTMLEAMGLGRAVIGTDGSSMEEFIVDSVSGFLVPPGDPDALAEKICSAWNRPDLEEIGERAKGMIDDQRVEKILPELLAFYQKHLNKT